MSKVSFNVDAYTARLIGRENVAKLNGAILELVKNTYDADASVCFIYFDENKQEVYIGDNGCGMTREIIRTNWMTIGRSSKKEHYVSQKGRVQTGAKGIGRFALDRIADQCIMLTISSSEGGCIWKVDWRDFEKESEITDVSADLSSTDSSFMDFISEIRNEDLRELIRGKFDRHGTVFRLSDLRDEWNATGINDLKKELNSLIPFEMSGVFSLYLFDNASSLYDATVLHDNEAFSYDYKIHFEVDDSGRSYVLIWRNEFDFGDKFEYIMENAGFSHDDREHFDGKPIENTSTLSEIIFRQRDKIENPIGRFHGTLYFAKLSVPQKDKKVFYYKDVSARKEFRDAFGGIKIYRDQFRVRPYGDANSSNYDWLQLAARQSSSPAAVSHPDGAWRVRANQMLGSVFISRTNIALPDQANREGIVETKEFGLLKSFLGSVIQLFERDRQYVCRKLAELYKEDNLTEQIIQEIAEKAKWADRRTSLSTNQNLAHAADSVAASDAQLVIESKEAEIRNLEDENRLLRVLATTGIVTNAYIHEFSTQTHRLKMYIDGAQDAIEDELDPSEALSDLKKAKQVSETFSSWFRVTIESIRKDRRTRRIVDLNAAIRALCLAWQEVVQEKKIKIQFDEPEEIIEFSCYPYELDLIISNLITNSIAAFTTQKCEEKTIYLRLHKAQDMVCLSYADNGPGLVSDYKQNPQRILDPHETNKRDEKGEMIGTGMGMWLIKQTVSEYTGSIDLSANKTEVKGFHFVMTLPQNLKKG